MSKSSSLKQTFLKNSKRVSALNAMTDEEKMEDSFFKGINHHGGTGYLMKPKPSKKKRRNNSKKKKEITLEPLIKIEESSHVPVEEKPVDYRFRYGVIILIILLIELLKKFW